MISLAILNVLMHLDMSFSSTEKEGGGLQSRPNRRVCVVALICLDFLGGHKAAGTVVWPPLKSTLLYPECRCSL